MIETGKRMRAISLLTAGIVAVALGGCASIITGTRQDIAVQTSPPGAHCMLKNGDVLVGKVESTPGTTNVPKSSGNIRVNCAKQGFQNASTIAKPRFQPWVLGNVLIGGIIGVSIDAATGAGNRYPKKVSVNLQPSALQQYGQPYGQPQQTLPQQGYAYPYQNYQQPAYGYQPQPAPNPAPYRQQPAPAGKQDVLVIDAGN